MDALERPSARPSPTGLPANARVRAGAVGLAASSAAPPASLDLVGFRAGLIVHDGMEIEIPPQAHHRLSIAVGRRPEVTTDIPGRRVTGTLEHLSANIVPADMATWVHDPAPGRFLFLRFDAARVAEWLEAEPQRLRLRPGVGLRDDLIRQGGERVLAELDRADAASTMMLEGVALQLAAHLARAHGHGTSPPLSSGGLAPWQVRRVTDYLNDHLDVDVSLDTLAGLAGLSRYHFARAFRRATGLPPHRFQMQLRLARAASLLETGNEPVQSVARRVGYAPSTLIRLFRRCYGTTPARFRALRRC